MIVGIVVLDTWFIFVIRYEKKLSWNSKNTLKVLLLIYFFGVIKRKNIFVLFFFFLPFKAISAASESSQARELQLLTYVTATAMPYLSCVWDLHHSSWQCRILNNFGDKRSSFSRVVSV